MAIKSKARHDLTLRSIKREIAAGRDVAYWLDKAYAEQIKAVIKRAPLGRYDRKIARLRYVDQLCQVDIAARVPYCRTSIGNRLKIIDKLLNV